MASGVDLSRNSIVGDLAVGAVAGIAGTAAMALLIQLSAKAGMDPQTKDAAGKPRIGSPEAATESVDILAETGTGSEVPQRYEQAATGAFQFAFGAGLGAAYALAARYLPAIRAGRGSLFGAAIYAALDEVLVPATGLTGKPQDSPAEAHVGALGLHLVFGVVLETVRGRLMRR